MNKNSLVKVMLVDDHPVVLNGLKNLLKGVDKIKIVAEASNGNDAILKLSNIQIDLLITDINMPEMSGIELTEIIKKKYPEVKVLILTVHNEKEVLEKVLFSGAEACLQKNTTKKELLNAINKILDGGYYYCDSIMEITRNLHNKPESSIDLAVKLCERELEVYELLLEGFSNKEIADKLSISVHTVSTHRRNIMKKTNSRNISGLYNYARINNLFSSMY